MASEGRVQAPHTTRTKQKDGTLHSACSECSEVRYAPDKGMGRATLAAWESRHGVNCTVTAPARGQS